MSYERTIVFKKWLTARYNKLDKSWPKVEASMKEKLGEKILDRRKLKEICEEEYFVISTAQLKALDDYFSPANSLSKTPLFERPRSILEQYFNDQYTIHIFIPARLNKRDSFVSGCDMKSFQRLLCAPELQHSRITIEDVLLKPINSKKIIDNNSNEETLQTQKETTISSELNTETENIKDNWIKDVTSGNWHKKLNTDYSLISLGSNYLSPATEILTALLLEVTPWINPINYERDKLLPYYLIWPTSKEKQYIKESCTLMELTTLKELFPSKAADMTYAQRAFVVGGNVYISNVHGPSYGLLVMQRTADDRVICLIVGTHGISTLGTSIGLIDKLPPVAERIKKLEAKNPILTAVFKCEVKQDSSLTKTGEGSYDLDSVEFVDNVILWIKNDKGYWNSNVLSDED